MLDTGQCLIQRAAQQMCFPSILPTRLAYHPLTALSHAPSHAPATPPQSGREDRVPTLPISEVSSQGKSRWERRMTLCGSPLAQQTFSFLENSRELRSSKGGLYYKVFPERENILTDLMEHAHAREVPSSWPHRTCLYIFCQLF